MERREINQETRRNQRIEEDKFMGTVVYVPSFGNNLVPQTREKSETKTVLETYQITSGKLRTF